MTNRDRQDIMLVFCHWFNLSDAGGDFSAGSAKGSNKLHKEIADQPGENEGKEEFSTRNSKAKCEFE